MLLDLTCLFYEARNNKLSVEQQMDACSEICRLAWVAGFTANDMAKILLIKD